MKKIPTNKWNPVKLDGISFENNLEGLIGIEECLDYNLDDLLQNNKKTAKRKNDKKEKEEELEPSPKKLKEVSTTKNAQKKKKVQQVIKQKEVKITEKPVESEDVFSPSKQGDSSLSTEVENDSENESETENTDKDETSSSNVEYELSQSGWGPLGLPVEIQKAIHELKFKEPTPIQAITLPPAILGRRDILGAAETGSGKTLAFGLPIVTGIMKLKKEGTDNAGDSESELSEVEDDHDENDDEDNDENSEESAEDEQSESESDFEENDEDVDELNEHGIGCVKSVNNAEFDFQKQLKPLYALILTPTRELAVQIRNHLIAICKYTDIRVAVIVGGMAAVKQERVLGKGPEIVVATPGRLWELLQQGNPHLGQIDNIKYLAIDETDRMVEKGHFQELHQILERINTDESKRQKRQNFVFSATLTLVHELPKHLVRKNQLKLKRGIKDVTPQQKLQKLIEMLGITDPKVVDITQGTGTPGTLTECRITCNIDEKDYYVYYFLQRHPGRTLIFCNSIGCVRRLTTILSLLSCQPLPLHSSMQQRQRLKNLDRFRDSVNGILVATDVAARGLDIASVAHVLHYQTPRTAESYVHRSGRTARASQEGLTLLLVEPAELQQYLRLCRTLGKTEDIPLFPIQDNYLNAVKERVNCARDLDKLELKVKKTNSEVGWLQKAADDMDMILDEVTSKYDIKEAQTSKKAADYKRKHLAALLSKQIFPRGFSGKYPLATGELLIPTTLTLSETSATSAPETAIEVMKGSISATGKSKTVGWKNPKGYFKKREVKLGAEKRQERRDKKKRANANSDGDGKSRKQGNNKKNRRN